VRRLAEYMRRQDDEDGAWWMRENRHHESRESMPDDLIKDILPDATEATAP
jgi:hypothetical protein